MADKVALGLGCVPSSFLPAHRTCTHLLYAVLTTSDLLKLSCGAGIPQNFGLQGVNVNFDALNEECLNVRIMLCTSLTL